MNIKLHLKKNLLLGIIGSLALCLSSASLAHAMVHKQPLKNKREHVPNRIIIKMKNNVALAQPSVSNLRTKHKVLKSKRAFTSLQKKFNRGMTTDAITTKVKSKFAKRSRRILRGAKTPDLSNIYVFEMAPGTNLETAIKDFRADPNVEYAELDGIATTDLTPNDPFYQTSGSWGQSYDDLYGLKNAQAGSAWDTATGQGTIVAVVDTGVDYNHPDLSANMWVNTGEIPNNNFDDDGNGYADDIHGYNFSDNHGDPIDLDGHGTHVSGTIAAVGNNNIGVIGLAFNAKIMALKGLGPNGSFNALADAIVYAADNGADVINNSWRGTESSLVENAVNYAHSLGVVIVASAGNANINTTSQIPSKYANVISVSAFDNLDQKASFSNWGTKIDVAAPGVNILSLRAAGTTIGPIVGSEYVRLNGTSMAAPHASALAALILEQNPTYTNEQVRALMRQSADDVGAPGFDIFAGHGRINAFKAMTTTLDTTPPSQIAFVNDGLGADIDETTSRTTLSANWAASNDSESGIAKYLYAIGTSPGSTDILDWTDNNLSLSMTNTELTLVHDTVYYISVKSINGGGFESTPTNSDGQKVNSPPIPGNALFDSTLQAPRCSENTGVCSSGPLLVGRGNINSGIEPNQPNTLFDSCADGASGTFHSDESLDALRAFTLDGTDFAAGKTIRIEADVWSYAGFSSDHLDLYSAVDANNPSWNYITTLTPTQTDAQTLQTDFVLPAGNLQAIRGNFRYNGSASNCSAGTYDDHDDLVFAVGGTPPNDTIPPTVSILTPGANSSHEAGTLFVHGFASDNVEVSKVEVKLDSEPFVTASGTTGWFLNVELANLTEGFHNLTARATDLQGNTGEFILPIIFVIPPVIDGPVISLLSPTSVRMTWITDEPASSQIFYDTKPSGFFYDYSTPLDSNLVSSHTQVITDLTPETLYRYKVESKDVWESTGTVTGTFTTLPETTINLVNNPGFESGNEGWRGGTIDTTIFHSGLNSIKASLSTQGNLTIKTLPSIKDISPNTSYTFETWVKYQDVSTTEIKNAGVRVYLVWSDSDGKRIQTSTIGNGLLGTSDWTKISQPITSPAGSAQVRVYLQLHKAIGTAWFDDVALLSGNTPSIYNLVINPSFEFGTAGWNGGTIDNTVFHSGLNSAKASLSTQGTINIKSAPSLKNISPNTNYTLETWLKYQDVSTTFTKKAGINILLIWYDSEGKWIQTSTVANDILGTSDWVKISKTITSPAETAQVRVYFQLRRAIGTVWFDDVSLTAPVALDLTTSAQELLAEDEEVAPEAEIILSPTLDDTFAIKEVYAYPNPSQGDPVIHIETGLADQVNIRIYNLSGEKVHEATVNQAKVINNAYAYEHKVTDLASGVYLYVIEATKGGTIIRDNGKLAIIK